MRSPDPRIDPHMAPNGLVFRFQRNDGTVVWFEPLPDMDNLDSATMAAATQRHHQIVNHITHPGAPSRMQIFDGDTGECVADYRFLTPPDQP